MKELKVVIGLNNENQILYIEPVNKVTGKEVEVKRMVARLLTQDDIDREISETMQLGCRTYGRVNRRIRERR